jgi:RNA polymerase sigma-70 factor (ECF subfamily)
MFAKLSEYIDNELDEVTCKNIEKHMAGCPPCQSCLTTLKRTVSLCKHIEAKPVPKEFSLKLKKIIDNLT